MKNKILILLLSALWLVAPVLAQNNTFSPYSRYGLGDLTPNTFAHNAGMGGTHIALRSDSTMPIFINAGNPASYPFIRLTTLEVGGNYFYSRFKGSNNTALNKWGTNFSYGTLGFPVFHNGGACFGIMPYTYVGYEARNKVEEQGIGNVEYQFNGNGGLNKAFIGYGILPFNKRLVRFRTKHLLAADSLRRLGHKQYLRREKISKLVNDFSMGFNVNYIFGNLENTTRIVYPNSLLYNNTYRSRVLVMGAFTGNFGAQTATTIDSITDRKGRKLRIEEALKSLQAERTFTGNELELKRDSISHATPLRNRALKQKVKFTFGYFMNLTNPLKVEYTGGAYNYVLSGAGEELIRDTVFYNVNQKGSITLPLEQGFGLGFKKGERLNIVADFAITDWTQFKYLDEVSDLKKNYRISAGMNFVPEKYAAGRNAFLKKVNYRLGFSYQTGYIYVKNSYISDYSVSLGVGLPVGIGRLSSMVNVSAQYGRMGASDPTLISHNYFRVNFGFTFCDRWFQKFRYD